MTKELATFDVSAIEVVVSGAVEKNTLPAVKENWKNWLSQFNAEDLTTDEDFKNGEQFVKDCKQIEKCLTESKDKILSGDILSAIKEIDEMKKLTAEKRLAFDKAVKSKKQELKKSSMSSAFDLYENLTKGKCEYRNNVNLSQELQDLIKGKSSLDKISEILMSKAEELANEQIKYSDDMTKTFDDVAEYFKTNNVTKTISEVEMIVRLHKENAMSEAINIVTQLKMQAEKEELENKLKEEQAKNEPTKAEETKQPIKAEEIKPVEKMTVRFGVVLECENPDKGIELLQSIGGKDIKFRIENAKS